MAIRLFFLLAYLIVGGWCYLFYLAFKISLLFGFSCLGLYLVAMALLLIFFYRAGER